MDCKFAYRLPVLCTSGEGATEHSNLLTYVKTLAAPADVMKLPAAAFSCPEIAPATEHV